MDARHFDALVSRLAISNSRRRLLAMLAMLAAPPILGRLLGSLDPAETAAKDRRRRRRQRHKKRKSPGGRKKGCRPKSKATICAGSCGPVKSRQTCGKTINCGSCACTPACDACFTCQEGPNTPGTCVVDPALQGETCGLPGQVCQSNGSCGCNTASCPAETPFCVDGVCGRCTAHAQCGAATICVDGICHACDVCHLPDVCAFTTIQSAINAMPRPETVYVCPGTYVENSSNTHAVIIVHPLQ